MTKLIAMLTCVSMAIFLPTMALSQNYMDYGGGYNQAYDQGTPGYYQPGAGGYQAYPNYNSYTNQSPSAYPGGAYQNFQQPTMPGGYYQQPTNPGAYYQQQQNPYASYQQQGSYPGNMGMRSARNFQPNTAGTSLVEDGVYWNGQSDIDDESQYQAHSEQLQSVVRPQRFDRSAGPAVQPTLRAPRRKPARSVRRTAKESISNSSSKPSRTVVQWGKKAKKSESKTSLQWGKTAKPSMVGTEPGPSKENISQQSTPGGITVETKEASPKLQWGKKTQ